MRKPKLADGTVHKMPDDLKKALVSNITAVTAWESLTPLARNEWICWTVTTKKQETRNNHIERTVKELTEGVRRPCCWIGCIHRKDKPVSASVKWVLSKQTKK